MEKLSLFYNADAQYLLKIYEEKRQKYLSQGIKKQPYEIMEEIKNAINGQRKRNYIFCIE